MPRAKIILNDLKEKRILELEWRGIINVKLLNEMLKNHI